MVSTDTSISRSDKETERKALILKAAFETISTYGFKRSSMDDIARAAGISRPALYQHFANKNEIFRAKVAHSLLEKEMTCRELVESKPDYWSSLTRLLEINFLAPYRMLANTPHGIELLGLKSELAPDLFHQWSEHSETVLKTALATHENANDALAADLAQMIVIAMETIKMRQLPMDAVESQAASLLRIVKASLGEAVSA